MVACESALHTTIQADLAVVYRLVAELELWPAIFPHVRLARVLRRAGNRRLVTVRAAWRGLPVGWRAVQTLEPAQGRVTFRHVVPLTRGTTVTWTATPTADGVVTLSVEQQVALARWVPGRQVLRRILTERIGPEMGRLMLERVREIAEGGSLAGRR